LESPDHEIVENETPQKKKLFTRRKFLSLLGTAAIGSTLGYTFYIEPFWVRTKRINISVPNLPQNWIGKTFMHISDLHIGDLVPSNYLIQTLKETHAYEPDMIVITGDLTDSEILGSTWENDEAVRILKHLPSTPHGTLMIMGNHDYGVGWSDSARADDLDKKLTDNGIHVLRNSSIEIDGLKVAGIDDIWSPNFFEYMSVKEFDFPNLHLILAHNPDVCDYDIWEDFEGLFLAGHTHGGQCKPPFLPPPLLPVRNKEYTKGLFELKSNRSLYINPGLGFIQQVRFNARPEVTLITLA